MLRRERYIGVLDWGDKKKGYRLGTKVRARRAHDDPNRVRVVVPELRILDDSWAQRMEARSCLWPWSVS